MTEASKKEATMVARAIEGDMDAFGELYLNYLDAIYRYIFFRIGHSEDAEDLTEQVFLKAWEALPSFKQDGNRFSSWIYRIAHNLIIDHKRRQKPISSTPLSEAEMYVSKPTTTLEQVIRSEEAAALASAISQLSEEEQQVIILRFIEGLRHAEVAQIMDKKEGACRAIQFRALSTLNRLLADMQEGM